jgi:hypothetical protein
MRKNAERNSGKWARMTLRSLTEVNGIELNNQTSGLLGGDYRGRDSALPVLP